MKRTQCSEVVFQFIIFGANVFSDERKLTGIKLGCPASKGKPRLNEHSADIFRLVALRVLKTIIAKQYDCSVGNLYNFMKYTHKVN